MSDGYEYPDCLQCALTRFLFRDVPRTPETLALMEVYRTDHVHPGQHDDCPPGCAKCAAADYARDEEGNTNEE